MKGYEKVNAISREARLVGAKFVSLADDGMAILSNPADGSAWEVPYGESEGCVMFDGARATMVKRPARSKTDDFTKNVNRLRGAISGIFSDDYKESIQRLRGVIATLPYTEANEAGEAEMCEKHKKPLVDGKCQACEAEDKRKATEKKEPGDGTQGKIKDAMDSVHEAAEEFGASAVLFYGQSINRSTVSMSAARKAARLVAEETERFSRFAKAYGAFRADVARSAGEATDAILEALNYSGDIEASAARAIAVAKAKLGDKVNAVEAARAVAAAARKHLVSEEQSPKDAAPFTYNFGHADSSRPKYLKFRTGDFTYEDVKTVSLELAAAMGSKDLTAEELDRLGDYRVQVEYMLQSKQICDRVLASIIEDFNKTFIKTDDDYNSSPLGWRNRGEQFSGWAKGWARSGQAGGK